MRRESSASAVAALVSALAEGLEGFACAAATHDSQSGTASITRRNRQFAERSIDGRQGTSFLYFGS
jgi:hypothetical protein